MDVTFYALDADGEWEIDHEAYAGPLKTARAMVEEWMRGHEADRMCRIQEA